MEGPLQDVRYSMRMLRKNPMFTSIAVLTLALGIGANTAIFTVINAVLLRQLPYDRPEQLVAVFDSFPSIGFPVAGLSEAEFIRLRTENRRFAELAAWNQDTATLRGVGEPERVRSALASENLFRTLGAEIRLGRGFTLEEEAADGGNVVILSHGFWQQRFGGDTEVIGRLLNLDGRSYTVIGVLGEHFKAPPELRPDTRIEMWLGYGFDLAALNRGSHGVSVVGRLNPGATLEQAQAETRTIISRVMKDYPDYYPAEGAGFDTFLLPLQESIVGDVRPALLVMLAAVAAVLLIACANVANLLLVRGEARQKEMAVRAALGASQGRIVRQLMSESLLLGMLGAVPGLLLASWGLEALLAMSPPDIPRLMETSLDLRVLGFVLLVSLLTSLIFGLAPVFHTARLDLNEMLKQGGRSDTGQRSRSRLQQCLIVLETAMALVLLVSAGLLVRSVWNLQNTKTGFVPDHLLTMRLTPPGSAYNDSYKINSLYGNLIQNISGIPGVRSAAVADPLPISGNNNDSMMEIEGKPFDMSSLTSISVDARTVTPDYLKTMGIPLEKGRMFDEGDLEGSPPVAIVNATFARNHWPGEDPLGKRFRYLDAPPERATSRFVTVVGVMADSKNRSLSAETRQEALFPIQQHEASFGRNIGLQQSYNLVVRADVDPASLAGPIREAIHATEREFIITNVRTMEQLMAAEVLQPRFNMILLSIFAIVALGLGGVGIYGVTAYSVARRTHEIGIRVALGARTRDILGMIIARGMRLVIAGLLIGLAGSYFLTRVMGSLLYGVKPSDPLTLTLVAVLLAGVALLACYIPARKATRVDPLIALRDG